MSWREKLFIEALHKDAKITLEQIMSRRRSAFSGDTPVLLRVKKYKQAGEVRDTRVSVVRPQLNTVRLWSVMKQARVKLDTTPQMLRFIEASGGLDDYLLQTPDDKLKSNAASLLKLELLQMKKKGEQHGTNYQLSDKLTAQHPPPLAPLTPQALHLLAASKGQDRADGQINPRAIGLAKRKKGGDRAGANF
eukprot:CAMPEP_0119113942 /NCGR_PEP_ID=MMETSP1180-20130426/45687_1 /TAXON_ID=3052 ORGANISM="Chlamydomonas cf sp, Strain CCMP681" /NCGR_SAMPLE_ID=MMETSP1180 /ASSEMBLY_ACC=CAM_ASM_000741 /LENGTH=191 /DNA_ID=CAMNT_0007102257 /DNA_START=146 /DNA_END=723 /DNA_ORIENTATION=-